MTTTSGQPDQPEHFLRRHRRLHYLCLAAAIVLALLIVFWARPGQSLAEAYSVSRVPWGPSRVTVPVDEAGHANMNLALAAYADRYAGNAQAWREADPWVLNVESNRGRVTLRALQTLSRGAIRFTHTDEQLAITLDPNRLDAATRPWRTGAGRFLESQFPELAARVDQRFRPLVFQPDATETASLDDAGQPLTAPEHSDTPLPDHVIVLVHGLDEPGVIWDNLRPALLEHGYTVIEFNYPNDGPIDANARRLDDMLALLHARGVTDISLVTHSMGGLVAMELLTATDLYASDGQSRADRPTVHQLISVATPWYGSPWARLRTFMEIRDQGFRLLAGDSDLLIGGWFDGLGEAYVDLLRGSDIITAIHRRPRPHNVPITVIAGRLLPASPDTLANINATTGLVSGSFEQRYTPWLRGLDQAVGDGVVPLSSAYLKGEDDYHLVHGDHHTIVHSLLPNPSTPPPAVPIIVYRLNNAP